MVVKAALEHAKAPVRAAPERAPVSVKAALEPVPAVVKAALDVLILVITPVRDAQEVVQELVKGHARIHARDARPALVAVKDALDLALAAVKDALDLVLADVRVVDLAAPVARDAEIPATPAVDRLASW